MIKEFHGVTVWFGTIVFVILVAVHLIWDCPGVVCLCVMPGQGQLVPVVGLMVVLA